MTMVEEVVAVAVAVVVVPYKTSRLLSGGWEVRREEEGGVGKTRKGGEQ